MNTRNETSEVGPDRRRVLELGGLLAALPLVGSGRPAWARMSAQQRDAFDEFTAVWQELAEDYLQREPELEEPYLYRLASRITSAVVDGVPPRQRKVFESDSISTGPCWGRGPIFVVALNMEPGAVLHPHNHPNHNVVTVGLEGAAQFTHYEIRGDAPGFEDYETEFQVQRTRRGVLTRGRMSHLSRERDNVHAFRAGEEGAVVLDFTTELGEGDFGMMTIDEPLDRFQGVYRAHWREKGW